MPPTALPRWATAAAACLLLALTTAPAAAQRRGEADSEPRVHALLINGGANRNNNFLSHFEHIQEMHQALIERGVDPARIAVFNADGNQSADDMATRAASNPPASFWLLENTTVGRSFLPQTTFVNTTWEGITLRAARYTALRDWFLKEGDDLREGDVLLLYVTDHGQRGKHSTDNGTISLWSEQMSVADLRALLSSLRPGVRVVMMMSQCYSGTFANAMIPTGADMPDGQVCGYFATTADRQAWGCYPEGRAQQRLGHAFTLIDALRQNPALDDVHAQVTTRDASPDVPLRTSDAFAERLLQQRAQDAGEELIPFVDRLLAATWASRRQHGDDVLALDALAESYGLPSPRYLAATERATTDLQALRDELDRLHDRWDRALDQALQENLDAFLKSPAATARGYDEALKALRTRDEAARAELLKELLPALERFTRADAERWTRLRTLHANASDASDARYRMDIRLAINLRARVRLLHIAADALLRRDDADPTDRRAAAAMRDLRACEQAPLGDLAAPRSVAPPAPLPALARDLDLIERLRPAWLGIRYGAPDADLKARARLNDGAALVRDVEPGSPAAQAGVQKGDLLLGAGKTPFTTPDAVRDVVLVTPPGATLKLNALRDGARTSFAIHLRAREEQPPAAEHPLAAGAAAPRLGTSQDDQPHIRVFLSTSTPCPACSRSLNLLSAWSARTHTPVVVIVDDAEPARAFPELQDLGFALIADPGRQRFQQHGVQGNLTFFAVDPAGTIRFRQLGFRLSETFAFEAWRPARR